MDGSGGEQVKQVKKKRPPKKTVEQNLSNINSAESERKCEVQHGHHDPSCHSDNKMESYS